VLLTGASGSFGSAFLADTLKRGLIEKAVAFARGEHRLAELAERLGHPPELRLMVGDVRDPDRIHEALDRVDTVICAAALKRVDRINHDPREIMATNYQGTLNTVRAAVRRNVPRVLVISSDKACSPSSIYGASKFSAECYAIHANGVGYPQSRVAVVRYGNVVGSQGSVIPLWRRQVACGEPLTLTDERMTRFWITMPKAIEFVLLSLSTMRGGEVFIPRLRASRMLDVAETIGGPHVHITIIGMRDGGEKLHETLRGENESGRAIQCGDRFILGPAYRAWPYTPPALSPPLPPGFRWRSDEAPQMTAEELRAMVEEQWMPRKDTP
jgi:UDP-N-acetylglucosamine 4,6-dehydratase